MTALVSLATLAAVLVVGIGSTLDLMASAHDRWTR